jgi:hypothetical protein
MTVREAINLLAYGEAFYIQGAHSGKIYYKSYVNKKERLEQFLDERVSDTPFFTDLFTAKRKYGQAYTYPVIGIWMSDYYICHPEELPKEEA